MFTKKLPSFIYVWYKIIFYCSFMYNLLINLCIKYFLTYFTYRIIVVVEWPNFVPPLNLEVCHGYIYLLGYWKS